jgi:hypothetical protein
VHATNEGTDPQVEYADGDYGYDLVHEAMAGGRPSDESADERTAAPGVPDDIGGDYGYDMAHDMRLS